MYNYPKIVIALVLLSILLSKVPLYAQLEEGFTDALFTDQVSAPVGIEFIDTHLIYVWQQEGTIEAFIDGQKLATPVLDIQEEVSGTETEHGMLGLALHPEFRSNGWLYVSYVVDPHYLRFYGTDSYDPEKLKTWNATIGRVTRYQVDTSDYLSIVEGSRKVLIGDSLTNGIPVLAPSHGMGGLDFGNDGTLLVGTGDGTTWVGSHTGGTDYKQFGFDSMGLALGIISPEEDYGSLRAQLKSSYSGKILRLDPETGSGVQSNPFYDSIAPYSVASKVWTLGLRNPFRIRVKPNSGSSNPLDGKPGDLYIGDVGASQFEELNIVTGPAQNLGWPLYEGLKINVGYFDQWVENKLTPTLNNDPNCPYPFYRFNDLLVPPRKDHLVTSPDPCDSTLDIGRAYTVFAHTPPAVAYGNTKNNPNTVHAPGYDSLGLYTYNDIEDSRSTIKGMAFDGLSSVAGDFYESGTFPTSFEGTYFHADYGGWIKSIRTDRQDPSFIKEINPFLSNGKSVVYLRFNPYDKQLYYVVLDYSSTKIYEIRRISFGENPAPVSQISADTTFGMSPLEVHLSGEESYDPSGEALTYTWYQGDSLLGHFTDSTLVLTSINDNPENIPIKLIVSDEIGQIDSSTQFISLNNTPPIVHITSIQEGALYTPSRSPLLVNLEAEIRDDEQTSTGLKYSWEIKLRHNDHYHLEFTDTLKFTDTHIIPLSNSEFDKHSYLVSLTVIDSLGLSGYDDVVIGPDQTSSIYAESPEIDIVVYPNPAKSMIYISLPEDAKLISGALRLYDLKGTMFKQIVVDQSNANSKYNMDVSGLSPGLYFLAAINRGKMIAKQSIILE